MGLREKRKGLSIQAKLFGTVVVITLAIVGFLTAYFSARHLSSARAVMESKALTYARLLGRELEPAIAFDDRETAREVFEAATQDPEVTGIALYTESGKAVQVAGEPSGAPGGRVETLRIERGAHVIRAFGPIVSKEGPRGSVVIEIGLDSLLAEQARIRRTSALAGLGTLAVAFFAALAFSRSIARRLERIAAATDAAASGNLDHPAIVDASSDEIGQLARSFNEMTANLRKLVGQISANAAEESARLDRLVAERTEQLNGRNRDVRLVLDHVQQALATVDLAGVVSPERSSATEALLGPPSALLWDWLATSDPGFAATLQLGWEDLSADVVPRELILEQLPKVLRSGGRFLRFEYEPIVLDGTLARILVIATDVSSEMERERLEEESREALKLFEQLSRDRRAVVEYCDEASELVASLVSPDSLEPVALKRALHTLKGNSAMMGLESLAKRCHSLEDYVFENGTAPPARALVDLQTHWSTIAQTIASFSEARVVSVVEADEHEYARLEHGLLAGVPALELARQLRTWRDEPVERRLERLAEQIRTVAARLEKSVDVVSESNGVRLDARRWAPFWSAFVHVLRNAVDHGIESPEERLEAGKAQTGRICVRTSSRGTDVVVEVTDDGRGVDWEGVAARARRLGLPTSSHEDLVESLFADGMTTRSEVTAYSGRGVGMGAVRAACAAIGGSIRVESSPGKGARFEFRVPLGAETGDRRPVRGAPSTPRDALGRPSPSVRATKSRASSPPGDLRSRKSVPAPPMR